jgi:hypothetical protein
MYRNLIMQDIGARTEPFDVFAHKKGRALAAIRAFMTNRRSRRKMDEEDCVCTQCQAC